MSDTTDLMTPANILHHPRSDSSPDTKRKIEDNIVRDYKKKKISGCKEVNLDEVSFEDDVALQSNNYWYLQAEKTGLELESALKENERLCHLKATLVEENLNYKQMLDEVQSLMEVYQEIIKEPENDTGIDSGASEESHENISC